jgi:CHAD domain-containing protein
VSACYRRENRALRDAGRLLTPARDAEILVTALDDLLQRVDDRKTSSGLHELRANLQLERKQRQAALSPGPLSGSVTAIRAVKERIGALSAQRLDSAGIGKALSGALKRTRRAYRDAVRSDDDARWHEWRKQAKHFLTQLAVASPLDPTRLGKLSRRVHRLTDDLGDDHDLAVLDAKLARLAQQNAGARQAVEVIHAIAQRRRCKLQRKARKLGRRIDHQQPRRLRKRMARHARDWSATRASAH